MKSLSEIILRAIKFRGIAAVRKALYGEDPYKTKEAEAMRLFLESRMYKDDITAELEKLGEPK